MDIGNTCIFFNRTFEEIFDVVTFKHHNITVLWFDTQTGLFMLKYIEKIILISEFLFGSRIKIMQVFSDDQKKKVTKVVYRRSQSMSQKDSLQFLL